MSNCLGANYGFTCHCMHGVNVLLRFVVEIILLFAFLQSSKIHDLISGCC